MSYIKRRLLADWSDINFIIGTNPEDYIELRFSMSSIDAPSGLKAYMGTLVDQDDQMLQYQLRRVTQLVRGFACSIGVRSFIFNWCEEFHLQLV